jgi:acetyl esterase/lipase
MPSKQSEAVKRQWAAVRVASEQPDAEQSDNETWGDQTAEPREVDYIETDADGLPAMWAVPKRRAEDRVLLCMHGGEFVSGSVYSHRKMFGHLAKATGVLPGGVLPGRGRRPPRPAGQPAVRHLSGLVSIYIQVGGDEVLLDHARRLDEHARRAGVDVRLDVFADTQHTFQIAAGRAPEVDETIRWMADWVRPKVGL